MDGQAYYSASAQDWQVTLRFSQEELDKFLAGNKETVEEVQALIDNATMTALGY